MDFNLGENSSDLFINSIGFIYLFKNFLASPKHQQATRV